MPSANKASWSVSGTCATIYVAVVGIAIEEGAPNPWFAYWWSTVLLVVAVFAGGVGAVLTTTRSVRHIRAQKKEKFEAAVNKELERRARLGKHAANIAAPGIHKYPRGNVHENIRDNALSYKWKNGVRAAKAIPEGQGYRVNDPEGNEIGYAKDRDEFAALVEDHFPEVS